MMSELDKLNILEMQKQLKEKHLKLSIEQNLLDRNFQKIENLTQQFDSPEVSATDSLPFKSSVPINTVNLFITSLSNHFMLEIAQVFAQGFTQAKVKTKLITDEIPSFIPKPGLLQIIVAPHEFFPLFLELKITNLDLLKKITQNVYLLNVEQPGSIWFEIAYQSSLYAKGVFDINQQGVQEFQKRNIDVLHTPLGYDSSSFGLNQEFNDSLKNVDLLFLGAYTQKREIFISKNATFFNRYNSSLIISRVERPNYEKTPGFYTGIERHNLLKSSKILINVHAAARTYFEWHRVLLAMGHFCLVVSEDSEYIEPLINGEHLILTKLDDIPAICEYYLEQPKERLKMIEQAYQFINNNYTAHKICLSILKQFY